MKARPWIATLLTLALILALWSCLKDQKASEVVSNGIHFNNATLQKSSSGCATQSNDCAKVMVEYPVMVSGDSIVRTKVNALTKQKVIESLAVFSDHHQKLVVNIDSAMAEFIELYEDYITDSNFFTIPWELKIRGQVVHQSEELVCLRLDNSSYTGGAHPNNYTTLLNFNTQTGHLIQLKDVVKDVEEFKNIAEEILLGKKKPKEPSDEPIIELTSDSFFTLPENFAIQEDGILLYYNPYEASDYANGAISFLISYDELKAILSKEFRVSD